VTKEKNCDKGLNHKKTSFKKEWPKAILIMMVRNDSRSLIFFAFLDTCLPAKAGKTEDRNAQI